MKLKGNVHTSLFYACCALGAVVSLALGVSEATEKAPISIAGVEDRRDGPASVVEAEVTNSSDRPRCPEIRAAARDGEARDLAEVVARPVPAVELTPAQALTELASTGLTKEQLEDLATRPAPVGPGQTVRYRARIEGISEKDYEEKLQEYSVYVYELHDCPGQ